MELLFKCKIDLQSHGIKKNGRELHKNRKTGKFFIGKSSKLEQQEMILLQKLKFAKWDYGIRDPIKVPVSVKFTFVFPENEIFTKKGELSKRQPDLSNLYQLPEDCLQDAGIIENDHLIFSHDGSRKVIGSDYELHVEVYKYDEPIR